MVLIIMILILQTTLSGNVQKESAEGKLGFIVNNHGKIVTLRYMSPAWRAGIWKGDTIKLVDGKKFSLGRLNGRSGDQVTLTIQRSVVIPGVVEIDTEFERDLEYVDTRKIDRKTNAAMKCFPFPGPAWVPEN